MELQVTLPHVVTQASDEAKTLSVRYTELIPVLFKAIQELEARIQLLENK